MIVAAVAARDKARAEAYAKKHRIPVVHSTYEGMKRDSSISKSNCTLTVNVQTFCKIPLSTQFTLHFQTVSIMSGVYAQSAPANMSSSKSLHARMPKKHERSSITHCSKPLGHLFSSKLSIIVFTLHGILSLGEFTPTQKQAECRMF